MGEYSEIDVKNIGDDMTVKVMNNDIDADDKIGASKIKLSFFA
jgi:hypothetical protein